MQSQSTKKKLPKLISATQMIRDTNEFNFMSVAGVAAVGPSRPPSTMTSEVVEKPPLSKRPSLAKEMPRNDLPRPETARLETKVESKLSRPTTRHEVKPKPKQGSNDSVTEKTLPKLPSETSIKKSRSDLKLGPKVQDRREMAKQMREKLKEAHKAVAKVKEKKKKVSVKQQQFTLQDIIFKSVGETKEEMERKHQIMSSTLGLNDNDMLKGQFTGLYHEKQVQYSGRSINKPLEIGSLEMYTPPRPGEQAFEPRIAAKVPEKMDTRFYDDFQVLLEREKTLQQQVLMELGKQVETTTFGSVGALKFDDTCEMAYNLYCHLNLTDLPFGYDDVDFVLSLALEEDGDELLHYLKGWIRDLDKGNFIIFKAITGHMRRIITCSDDIFKRQLIDLFSLALFVDGILPEHEPEKVIKSYSNLILSSSDLLKIEREPTKTRTGQKPESLDSGLSQNPGMLSIPASPKSTIKRKSMQGSQVLRRPSALGAEIQQRRYSSQRSYESISSNNTNELLEKLDSLQSMDLKIDEEDENMDTWDLDFTIHDVSHHLWMPLAWTPFGKALDVILTHWNQIFDPSL
ncbi:hypothetical protein EDD86DRAFT_209388 [Gorgonomyces haynaldii]|nr:hypothetical protein EDD86DRAFT_209388 [Gorgonomyces haynaldii]